jgi:DNA repair exonuclease SbcCD ATPase subunit
MKSFIVGCLTLFCISLLAQKEVSERSFKMDKKERNGFQIELEIPEKTVIKAAERKLKAWDIKTKERKNVYSALAANFPKISSKTIDFYLIIENKKNTTTITAAASLGYDLFVNSREHSAEASNLRNLVKEIAEEAKKVFIEERLAEEMEKLAEMEKEMKKRSENQVDMQKENENYTKKIEENKTKMQENQKSMDELKNKIEDQKKAIDKVKQM